MKKIIVIVICLLLNAGNMFAQNEENSKYKITPTKDKNFPMGFYIPENLEDCFKELERMLSSELIEEMKFAEEKKMIKYHRGLGMWMRNNWGLRSGSRLSKYFRDMEIRHPDDISGIILNSFWRYLNSEPMKLEKQIKYYQDYWKKMKEQKDKK